MPNPANPQSLNRYSYCLNNPLKYVDPSGHDQIITSTGTSVNGQEGYFICDGAGNLLSVAYGIDDLAAKMSAVESQSRGVDLPVAKQTVDTSTPQPAKGTEGLGINISGGAGVGISLDLVGVRDTQGNGGFAISVGFGGSTPNISIGRQVQSTTAQNIYQLNGWSGATGASLGPFEPFYIGGEYIGYKRNDPGGWEGTNITQGWGLGVAEVHGFFSYTWVIPLDGFWKWFFTGW